LSLIALRWPRCLSVADVLAKSDALEKKGMLAIFSSDLRLIRAGAQRDVDAFAAELRSAHNAHRSTAMRCCAIIARSLLKRRGMSSVQAFAEFMKVKYPATERYRNAMSDGQGSKTAPFVEACSLRRRLNRQVRLGTTFRANGSESGMRLMAAFDRTLCLLSTNSCH
jgi:hypothetical protein